MNIFENLETLNVSEECYNDIVGIVEEYINEYIKKDKREQLLKVAVARQKRTDNAPEGAEKEAAQKKERRNVDLTNSYFERHGSPLQKAVKRGYSKNKKEKEALLRAGWMIKEDPVYSERHNIVKY